MKFGRLFWLPAIAVMLGATLVLNRQSPPGPSSASSGPLAKAIQSAVDQSPVAAETTTEGVLIAPNATSTRLHQQSDLWRHAPRDGMFAEFYDWTQKYLAARTPEDRAALEATGLKLARERREALARLIVEDPERALALAVPAGVRRALPQSIQDLLETPVSARGDLAVLAALAEPGKESETIPVFRTATIGDVTYDAYVYGRRLGEPTRFDIPLHGVTIDNLFAVSENAVRLLDPAELADLKALVDDPLCAISGQSSTVNNEETGVDVGGSQLFVCSIPHAEALNDKVAASEGDSGPTGDDDDGGVGAASAWTEGQKKLILIRVDFPDLTGDPFTDTTGINLVSNLNNFYTEMSYGRASFTLVGAGSAVTPTFRLTNSASYYGTNNFYAKLRTDARAAATAAGYTLSSYNLDIICFKSVPGWTWAGLGYVGSAGSWLRNSFGTGVAAHELGHNYGLNHANYWDTSGQSSIGPGTSVEYGDSFDTMGAASAGNNHFNARYKNYLNWLTSSDVLNVTSNGTYRIYAHDNPNSTGLRGLRVAKNTSTNYWIEFRQKFTGNRWLMSGAGLRWAQSSNQKSQLLDTTPGSSNGKNDAAIVIGRTFSDYAAGIHITPIGKGGTTPESLDVVVNKGSFPGNLKPIVTVTAPLTNASANVTLAFSAAASDPNSDTLAYYWDFGDANFGTNGPTASKSWSSSGEYIVRCTVTDMKGGTASDSVLVRIGSPSTYRISGTVTSGGNPVEGVRVYVNSSKMSYTDSDGTYIIPGLSSGSYTVAAGLYGYAFVADGFGNPVSVGPQANNINFYDSLAAVLPSITAQPQGKTVAQGSNVTFSVTATGTAPLGYQWRFNGTNIGGATASAMTVVNAQAVNAGSYSVVVSNMAGQATSSAADLTVVLPPEMDTISDQTIAEGSLLTFTVTADAYDPGTNFVLADFESATPGQAMLFQLPSYSSTTWPFLGPTPDIVSVTTNFPSGHAGGRALNVAWSYQSGTINPWLRLTTFAAVGTPNPTIDFGHLLKFDIYVDRPVKLGIGLRETNTGTDLGQDGGTSGPIEFAGVSVKNGNSPDPDRVISAGSWTTVGFYPIAEPISSFTGNGILESATGKGVLEHLAFAPMDGSGTYTVYLDNFTLTPMSGMIYSLEPGAPAGAAINQYTGEFSWTPAEDHGPGEYDIVVRATRLGYPTLSDTQTFHVTVTEANNAPELAVIPDVTLHIGSTLTITNAAVDSDMPANGLVFSLDAGAPAGAAVDPGIGVVSWNTAGFPAGTNYSITVRVTDDGVPPLHDTKSFTVNLIGSPDIQVSAVTNGEMELRWPAIPGKTYRVQYKDNLGDPGWTDLTADLVASGDILITTDAIGTGQRFYRIVQVE